MERENQENKAINSGTKRPSLVPRSSNPDPGLDIPIPPRPEEREAGNPWAPTATVDLEAEWENATDLPVPEQPPNAA